MAHGDKKEQSNILQLLTFAYIPKALRVIKKYKYASPALFQRELKINYEKAAALIDKLFELDYIGPRDGAKPRSVNINRIKISNEIESLVNITALVVNNEPLSDRHKVSQKAWKMWCDNERELNQSSGIPSDFTEKRLKEDHKKLTKIGAFYK